jgi:hypothetical protein
MQALYPSNRFKVLTPSDTAEQTYTCAEITGSSPLVITSFKALYVAVSGDVVIKNDAGTAITFAAVPAGVVLPISGHILMAATTATVIGIF